MNKILKTKRGEESLERLQELERLSEELTEEEAYYLAYRNRVEVFRAKLIHSKDYE